MKTIHKDGTTYLAKRCDYRHRGKTKTRYILRECYRNGSLVEPKVTKFASKID